MNAHVAMDLPELQAAVREKEAVLGEHDLLKRRTEALMADYEQEKQVRPMVHTGCALQ